MTAEVTIVCDGCSEVMGGGRTAKVARDGLRHVKGIRLGLPGGIDFCPDCAGKGRSATPRAGGPPRPAIR